MSRITAKAVVNSVQEYKGTDGEIDQVSIGMNADYSDGRNKEWAKYTPALSVNISVKPELAHLFPMGQAFTLTFEAE